MKQLLTLKPGESKEVTFSYTPTEAKSYQVTVDGLSGSFMAVSFPTGITILGITGEKQADGSIIAEIPWTYQNINVRDTFATAVTSIGRMENGVWNNYYTVEHFIRIPSPGAINIADAYWAPQAVNQMPRGPAGFRTVVTIWRHWQEVAKSELFTAKNVIVI